MKLVSQKLGTDCGLACLAMLTGSSLECVVSKVGLKKEQREKKFLTNSNEIKRYAKLLDFNHQIQFRKADKWKAVQCTSMVGINPEYKNGRLVFWHWVVFVPSEGLIYDPDKNAKKQIRHPKPKKSNPWRYLNFEVLDHEE